jgi:hypothetical protein
MRTQVKKNIGATGLANVRVLNDSLRVVFPDGDTYQTSKEGWTHPNGEYNVTLDPLGSRVLFVSPPPLTTHLVRFRGFGNRGQSNIPEPKIQRGGQRQSKHGGTYLAPDELKAFVDLEVVGEGPYVGMKIFYSFSYAFEPDPGTQNTLISASQSKLVAIEEFLRINGFDILKDDIPFSSNVLPWLEKKFLAAAKVYQVSLSDKGFVKQITEVPAYLLPKNLTGAKKAKAPAAKKVKSVKK